MELDALDRIAARAFDGYLVRKDLVRQFSKQFPVPTYVVEFMLGRYCASIDEAEIQEGLEIVQRQLALPPGQIWTIGPGGMDEYPGLFRIEVNSGPGSHVKVLNRPAPAPFMESVRYAEQNLYARGRDLVGDRDPRSYEFTVQLRVFDASKSGHQTGVGVLVALCSSLLQKSIRGGLVLVGGIKEPPAKRSWRRHNSRQGLTFPPRSDYDQR